MRTKVGMLFQLRKRCVKEEKYALRCVIRPQGFINNPKFCTARRATILEAVLSFTNQGISRRGKNEFVVDSAPHDILNIGSACLCPQLFHSNGFSKGSTAAALLKMEL